jgi:hypothetical protein
MNKTPTSAHQTRRSHRRRQSARREVIPVVAVFCIVMMLAMMWMMMGGMSPLHRHSTDSRDATRDAEEPDGRSS